MIGDLRRGGSDQAETTGQFRRWSFDHHTIDQVAERLKVWMDHFGTGLTRQTSKKSESEDGGGREDGYPMNH